MTHKTEHACTKCANWHQGCWPEPADNESGCANFKNAYKGPYLGPRIVTRTREIPLIKARREESKQGCLTEVVVCGNGKEFKLSSHFGSRPDGDAWLESQMKSLPLVIACRWPEIRDVLTGVSEVV